MTAPAHVALTVNVSHPPGFRGACTCGNYEGPRQGALALAERDAQEHAKEGNRCRRRVFRSSEAAEGSVDPRQRNKTAAYCAECQGWHLTSQPQSVTA